MAAQSPQRRAARNGLQAFPFKKQEVSMMVQ
jgi:hypothetical protein